MKNGVAEGVASDPHDTTVKIFCLYIVKKTREKVAECHIKYITLKIVWPHCVLAVANIESYWLFRKKKTGSLWVFLGIEKFPVVMPGVYYILEVLRGQPIKIFHAVFNSEFLDY